MAYTQTAERDFLGYLVGAKIGPTGSAQMIVPASSARPRNPYNNAYMPSINNTQYPSLVVQGKRTPSLYWQACYKYSWVTAANINSWLFNQTAGDTDTWSWGLYQATAGIMRRYDYAKCMQFDMGQSAAGGPINCSTAWDVALAQDASSDPLAASLQGVGLAPSGVTSWNGYNFPTWTTPTTDPGQLANVAQCSWSGVNQVRSWRATLIRGQMPANFIDGTPFAADITSGMFSGVLTIEQSPSASSVISSTGTPVLTIGTTGLGGIGITFIVSADDLVQSKESAFGTVVRTYSLIALSTGGNPCTVVAL